MSIDRLDDEHLLDEMFDAMHDRGSPESDALGVEAQAEGRTLGRARGRARGRGGWVVTVDLDVLRRQAQDPELRALYGSADVRVAGGLQLLWASRLQGQPLPARIAGTSLALRIASRAADDGRALYLLGGDPGAAEGAQTMLQRRYPGLEVCGSASGRVSSNSYVTPPLGSAPLGVAPRASGRRPGRPPPS